MAYLKHWSLTGQAAHNRRARTKSSASLEKNGRVLPLQAAC
jgi:hypothetical protein